VTGLLAGFDSEHAMQDAAARLRAEGLAAETHAPKPPEHVASLAPLAVLAGGALGVAGGFLMQAYATTISYPVDIGGRPDLGWPALVPMAFELGMLCAIVAGVLAFLVTTRLPRPYSPIDEVDAFRRASRDLFFVALESDAGRARELVASLRPTVVEEFET
jgi:hypothetical protein